MKKISCVFIAILFAIGVSSAQDYSKVKYNPVTPFTGEFTGERFTGDSIYFYDKGKYTTGGQAYYKRSKDGLRDTVFTGYGLIFIDEYVYSPEGKLVTMKSLIPDIAQNPEFVLITRLETNDYYDAEGRIATITMRANGDKEEHIAVVYDYTQNTIDGWNGGFTHVVYTDSGYICHTKDYDSLKNRITEYVFDSENRLMKMINRPLDGSEPRVFIEYTYTDHGYWEHRGDSYKTEYTFFEKESQPQKTSEYELTYRGWKLIQTTDRVYYYGDIAMDIDEPVIQKTAHIYGITGAVVVELEKPTPIAIYAINGQLIRRQRFDAGWFHIPMRPGFYIVQAGEDVFKLKVN